MASKFIKVKCGKCKNEQMVFEKAASTVRCLVCDEILAESTGGKARINVKTIPKQEKDGKEESEEEKEE